MKVLVVDDEALARQRLKRLLEESGSDYELVGEASNGKDAVIFCSRQDVDVVLMDIHMPGMDGLEAAAELAKKDLPPAVIFTTAFSEHALSAFDASAADYLLKPIRREKLQLALQKASQPTRLQASKLLPEDGQYLVAKYRGGIERVPVSAIYYFRADNKYVIARHDGGELLLEDSLKSLEQRFSTDFIRIHRNALVALDKIRTLEKDSESGCRIRMVNIDEALEVSRRHLPGVRELIGSKAE